MAKRGRKRTTSRRTQRISKEIDMIKRGDISRRKFNLLVKNLILFAILFVVSLILYSISSDAFYENLFLLLSIIFGFLAIAFVIAYLILLIIKILRK